ncbi:MAG: right-handed parallel beta-helix repeat-containing protein [Phycisphaerae bacterium]|nr:right-handed parallel beta-helix repeat-containing protein [Phycisphaerae bacterium]
MDNQKHHTPGRDMRHWSIQFLLYALLCGPAWGAAYYVDPVNGNAANPGSAERPWLSLKEALAPGRLAAGDTVYLRTGDYGSIAITGRHDGFVTLQAVEGQQARASSVRFRNARFWCIRGLTVSAAFAEPYKRQNLIDVGKDAADIAVEGCTLYSVEDSFDWSAEDWVAKACNGIMVNGTRVRIDGNYLLNVAFGINVSGTHNTVTCNTVENFSGDGMRALGDDCVFRRNIIKNCYNVDDNHDDGIQSWSTGPGGVGTGVVKNVILDGNLIINTTDPDQKHRGTLQGIGCFDGMFENWLIVNNIIVVDHFHGISLYGAKNCRILNNTVIDNRPGRPVPWIMITKHKKGMPSTDNIVRNNLTQQPISPRELNQVDHNVVITDLEAFFANWRDFDFRLKPGCAAIGAGSNEGLFETDFFGNTRASGTTIDAGALQSKP